MSSSSGAFEGPEKTLEVCFRTKLGSNPSNCRGLRDLPRVALDEICSLAKCTILSSISNAHLDAYVLSESSLFVYPYMLILKTCGTTTLLLILPSLIKVAYTLDLVLDWVGYSRKNLMMPEMQLWPHGSWEEEMRYIVEHRELTSGLNGNGYTLGPVTGDHWFVWVADRTIRSDIVGTDRVLNIMMFDIHPQVAEHFFYHRYQAAGAPDDKERIGAEMTARAGINELVPGASVDPRAFEPCGYSMNAILYNSYSTMHVTPQEECSYASFETNQKLGSYLSLINNVVRTFCPKRFILTLMADEGGLKEIKDNPLTSAYDKPVTVPSPAGPLIYRRSSLASIQIEDDTCCLMGNFCLLETSSPGSTRTTSFDM